MVVKFSTRRTNQKDDSLDLTMEVDVVGKEDYDKIKAAIELLEGYIKPDMEEEEGGE